MPSGCRVQHYHWYPAAMPPLKLSSGQDMSKELRIRFRHPAGDVGPQGFPDHATVQQLKSALHQSWPQDGPLAAEMPHSVDDIKIILGGKFLDSQQVLGAKDKDLVKGRSSCCCIQ
eukprot:jgi/Astpho2/9341/Aster-x1571